MVIYAVKCGIPKDEVEEYMYEKFEELRNIEHSNLFEEKDIISAL